MEVEAVIEHTRGEGRKIGSARSSPDTQLGQVQPELLVLEPLSPTKEKDK